MALEPTLTDARKLVPVIDADYESAEEAAKAVLKWAFALYERKAKFAVVAQVRWPDKYKGQADVNDSRVVLGPFGTWKQAESAGKSIAISSSSHAEARWLIAETWSGTPAAYYANKVKGFQEAQRDRLTNAEELSAIMRDRLLVVDDLRAGVEEVWTVTDDGEVVMDEDAERVRLTKAREELSRALQDGKPPLLSKSEAEAILGLIERSA